MTIYDHIWEHLVVVSGPIMESCSLIRDHLRTILDDPEGIFELFEGFGLKFASNLIHFGQILIKICPILGPKDQPKSMTAERLHQFD